MFDIRHLQPADIFPEILRDFHHRQSIRRQYVKRNGAWEIIEVDLLREWDEEKRIWLASYMRDMLQRGGAMLAAYEETRLIGFLCVDGTIMEGCANLTLLFVDDDFKRRGIGRALFNEACAFAREKGAKQLFISAVPSLETIAFYTAMGCKDAETIIPAFVDTEEDRYLSKRL